MCAPRARGGRSAPGLRRGGPTLRSSRQRDEEHYDASARGHVHGSRASGCRARHARRLHGMTGNAKRVSRAERVSNDPTLFGRGDRNCALGHRSHSTQPTCASLRERKWTLAWIACLRGSRLARAAAAANGVPPSGPRGRDDSVACATPPPGVIPCSRRAIGAAGGGTEPMHRSAVLALRIQASVALRRGGRAKLVAHPCGSVDWVPAWSHACPDGRAWRRDDVGARPQSQHGANVAATMLCV